LEYGLLEGGFAGLDAKIVVLCSPSGLATAYFDLVVWEGLALLMESLKTP
jgi:hypothetical protein